MGEYSASDKERAELKRARELAGSLVVSVDGTYSGTSSVARAHDEKKVVRRDG